MKRTKIICTMGPNLNDENVMRSLIENGMDIARFNFSHGDYEEHKGRMDMLKRLREEMKIPVAILLDTKGPEIRSGILEGGKKIMLKENETIVLTTDEVVGNKDRLSVSYKELPLDVKEGNTILIDDGLIGLRVDKIIDNKDIVCTIVNGGELGEKKGINVPNVSVNLPALTEKDKEDILFGIEQGVDYIAASFVRKAEDVVEIKELLASNNGSTIGVIAKIENAEGVLNIDSILKVVEGIMVARGDLGVEIPAATVPAIQKNIIEKCNHSYIPVITATQMLDSMMRNPRPTRAEVTDVANAVYDGTDAVMLSGETAMGKYPIEAIKMMYEVCEETEKHLKLDRYRDDRRVQTADAVSSAVGFAVVDIVERVKAACVVAPTVSGQTAKLVSNLRPSVPIYAVTPNDWVRRRMQLYWGVTPLTGYAEDSTENIISHALYLILREGLAVKGDIMVFTAGDPSTNDVDGAHKTTNMLQIVQAK